MNLKKAFPLFALPLLSLSLFGCSQSEGEDISHLNFGMLYDDALDREGKARFSDHSISLDYGDLAKKIEQKESFLLLIYETGNTCTCWYRYEASLTKLMKEESLLIYGIDPSEFGGGKETYGLQYKSGEENLVVFREGEILSQRSTNGVDDSFVEYENVSKWVLGKTHKSDMLRIRKTQLDSLFKESASPSFMVYFGRESCGDCSYVNSSFLFDYNKKDRQTSYYLDCDQVGIRFETEEDKKQGKVGSIWQNFKDEYGLSEEKNAELGYGVGYVPSFIVYNKGERSDGPAALVKDMCVAFNDEITKQGDKFVVSNSFYEERRLSNSEAFLSLKEKGMETSLIGLEVASEDLVSYDEAYYWKQKSAAVYEFPLLEGFLDFYLE